MPKWISVYKKNDDKKKDINIEEGDLVRIKEGEHVNESGKIVKVGKIVRPHFVVVQLNGERAIISIDDIEKTTDLVEEVRNMRDSSFIEKIKNVLKRIKERIEDLFKQ